MRVLLTGATGFLGSHLAKALITRGNEVLAYRRKQSNFSRLQSVEKKILWFDSEAELEKPFLKGKVDAVIHAATSYGRNGESIFELVHNNVLFPVELHQWACKHEAALFLNMHTALGSETSAYSLSKHQAAEWLDRGEPLPKIIHLELEHFYGPHDNPEKFMGWLLEKFRSNEPRVELTEGKQKRDFFHIKDAVSAVLRVLDKQNVLSHRQRIEVGSGESLPVRQVVERLHELSGTSSRLVFGAKPVRAGEPADSKADLATMTKLDWKPLVTLEEGLAELCEEAMQQRVNE